MRGSFLNHENMVGFPEVKPKKLQPGVISLDNSCSSSSNSSKVPFMYYYKFMALVTSILDM